MAYPINPDWWTIVRGTRFECTQCGKCCERPGHVYIHADDIEPVAGYLGLTTRRFMKKFADKLKGSGGYTLRMDNRGDCPFYCAEDKTCGIHPVKFIQCRTYPYWPEHVETPAAWSEVREECEGIGRGRRIRKGEVRYCLEESARF